MTWICDHVRPKAEPSFPDHALIAKLNARARRNETTGCLVWMTIGAGNAVRATVQHKGKKMVCEIVRTQREEE